MHYSDLPRVRDGALRFTSSAADEQTSVLVGSAQWYDLLEQIASFGFEDHSGRSFTARREQRDQQWYWYAYRKRGKKLTDVFLRSSKLRIPAPPAYLLQRPRLTQLLTRPLQDVSPAVTPNQRRTQTLLTVITAPAGYGKSTLLSEWLHHVGDLDVGWLSLDPEDNHLQQFWRYVVAALQTSVPELGRQALLLLQEPQPPAIDDALTALLDDLQHMSCVMVLVLDDYHVIDTPAIHDSLAAFLT